MRNPISATEKELALRLKVQDMLPIVDRWLMGIPHHPKANSLAQVISGIDWLFFLDSFGLRFGGDGDNGETLTYILDVYFELLDKESHGENYSI